MRKHFLVTGILLLTMLFSIDVSAQKFSDVDKSPHDISYFKPARNAPPVIKVVYGRPQKKGRTIFGNLVPYGKVWRTGANEATEITFFKDVKLGEQEIKAGTYSLFTIPNKDTWTIIINSDTDVWGSYYYDKDKDVARLDVPVKKIDALEYFSIAFTKETDGARMVLAWDNISAAIPFSF
ncbi:Protein of unknown function (DUF2911) [Kordia periserrulae]|uniref:DUF2911 family protein n=1 Tax=Kordia periserrulae TaxID=701523 RepID=A0A2T6BYW4_9FLAO|nr:DUF2911 domain-containing protein [Kordia periserrulae]PTX61167.1 Protein of unknown function (DUF2911) [Kordia periserrulae]